MNIIRLQHQGREQAEELRRVFFEAYTVEAARIGVAEFPPLRRTVEQFRNAHSRFWGCRDSGSLLAAAELEQVDEQTVNIAGFAVIPGMFRKGIGSALLAHILSLHNHAAMTVSTAKANLPAIALYEKHGFVICRHWTIMENLAMVTMSRGVTGQVPDRNGG